MAYDPLSVFSSLQVLTSVVMNKIRTNFEALWPYTAAGDISYASSSTALSRLEKGTAGQVLKMNTGATAPEWGASKYGVSVYNGTISTIMNSTKLPFASEYFDDDTMHDNSTNNSRLTCKKAGRYFIMFSGILNWSGASTTIITAIRNNGSDIITSYTPPTSYGSVSINVNTYVDLALNDYVEVVMDEGGTGGINVSVTQPKFRMFLAE